MATPLKVPNSHPEQLFFAHKNLTARHSWHNAMLPSTGSFRIAVMTCSPVSKSTSIGNLKQSRLKRQRNVNHCPFKLFSRKRNTFKWRSQMLNFKQKKLCTGWVILLLCHKRANAFMESFRGLCIGFHWRRWPISFMNLKYIWQLLFYFQGFV